MSASILCASMELRSNVRDVAGHRVLVLEGAADLASLPRLHDALRHLTRIADTTALAVDLDGVTLLDDASIGLVIGAARRARHSGATLTIVCAEGPLRRTLADSRVDRIVPVVSSLFADHPPTVVPGDTDVS